MIPAWLKYVLLAAVAGAVVCGIDANGYRRAEDKYKLQIANDDAKRAEATRKAELNEQQRRNAQAANVLQLSERLIAANDIIDSLNKTLQERAAHVSNFYRPIPLAPLQPVPGWIVTHGWVCDYNRAIGYQVGGANATVSGDAEAACTADAFSPSAVTGERILRHHEDYGAYCRKLEEQVNVLLDHIDYLERQGETTE